MYAPRDTGVVLGGDGNATYVIDTVDGGGGVLTAHLSYPGTGYGVASGVSTTRIIGIGNNAFTINITAVGDCDSFWERSLVTVEPVAAGIVESAVNTAGALYAPGDTGTIGSHNAEYVIDTVNGGGGVISYHLTSAGGSYSVDTNVPTFVSTGSGDGNFTVDITKIGGVPQAPTHYLTVQGFDDSGGTLDIVFDIQQGDTPAPSAGVGYAFNWRGNVEDAFVQGQGLRLVDPATNQQLFGADSVVPAPNVGVQIYANETGTAAFGDAVISLTGNGGILGTGLQLCETGIPMVFNGPQVDQTTGFLTVGDGLTHDLPLNNSSISINSGGNAGPGGSYQNQGPLDTLTLTMPNDAGPPQLPRAGHLLRTSFWKDIASLTWVPGPDSVIFNPPASVTQGQGIDFVYQHLGCGAYIWTRLNGPPVTSGEPYLIPIVVLGLGNSWLDPVTIFTTDATGGFSLPINLAGSVAKCSVAPTGNISLSLEKNGTGIGSIDFASGAVDATFTFGGGVSFVSSDVLGVRSPAPDATFSGLAVIFVGTKT